MAKVKAILLKPLDGREEGTPIELSRADFDRLKKQNAVRAAPRPRKADKAPASKPKKAPSNKQAAPPSGKPDAPAADGAAVDPANKTPAAPTADDQSADQSTQAAGAGGDGQ